MRFKQLYSGSNANAYLVTTRKGRRIMIECGVAWAKLQKAIDYNMNIDACFISHSHQDHCKAIHDVIRAGIDVYTTADTFAALGVVDGRCSNTVRDKDLIRLGDGVEVYCFEVNHDCDGCLGFRVRDNNDYLLFATDTRSIVPRFTMKFSIIALECSYDPYLLADRVRNGTINETLAKRLLDSHMSKDETKRYLANCCNLSKCKEIHLLHMSGDNIIKANARREFKDLFMIETRTV